MITEDYFLAQIRSIAHMRLLNIPVTAAKEVYQRFSSFEQEDLDKAIDAMISSDERFDFTKLLRSMSHRRADRLEYQSGVQMAQEADAARRFFGLSKHEGKCTGDVCKSCKHFNNCSIRAREWFKNIETIMSKKRKPGEGKRMAEEAIKYMKDFRGEHESSRPDPGPGRVEEDTPEEFGGPGRPATGVLVDLHGV